MFGPVGDLGNGGDDVEEQSFGGVGVGVEVFDDHFDGDVVVVVVPAVVIRDHGGGGVGDLRLAGALGFAEVGHADDVMARGAVGEGFGACAERGAFHAHVGAAVVGAEPEPAGGGEEEFSQILGDRVGEGDVGDDAAAEEGVGGGLLGAVDELVDEDDVAGAVLALERSDGADAEDPGHAEFFEGPEVGAVGHLGGQQSVSPAVARQEDDVPSGEAAGEQAVGGIAERGAHGDPAGVGEAVDLVEAGAADDPDSMGLLRHARPV